MPYVIKLFYAWVLPPGVFLLVLLLAEGQVIAGLIVFRIIAKRLLIGLDGLAVHPVILTDHADVVIGL